MNEIEFQAQTGPSPAEAADRRILQLQLELKHSRESLAHEVQRRRAAEQKADDAGTTFNSYFDACPLMIGIVELRETEIHPIIGNQAVRNYFGLQGDELGIIPNEFKIWRCRYESTLRERRPKTWEHQVQQGDRTRHLMVTTNFAGWSSTGHSRFCYIIEDITERKTEETRKNQETARLAHLSKMSSLGEMASAIAHEVNNPLTIIQGLAELMGRKARQKSPSTEELQNVSQQIISVCQRISKIITGLKFYAREAGNDPIQTADLSETVFSALSFCTEKIRKTNIQLEINRSSEPVSVRCRAVQVSQVIINLLSNAVDAVAAQPERKISIRVFPQDEFGVFEIVDTGPGIDPEVSTKIFDPFFTTKPPGQGTGLGLSICRGILASQASFIEWIGNQPGACFQVRIPIDRSTTQKGDLQL